MLLEEEKLLGGKIVTHRDNGFIIEAGPDAFLRTKPQALRLSEDLNLTDQVISPLSRKAYLLKSRQLHPIPTTMMGLAPTNLTDLLESTFLSDPGKYRAAIERYIPAKEKTGKEESVSTFLKRRFGDELSKTLLEPMTAGIYGGGADESSLDALFPALKSLEYKHGSVTNGVIAQRKLISTKKNQQRNSSPFFSFQNGTDTLIKTLSDSLIDIDVKSNTSATKITRSPNKNRSNYVVETRSGEKIESEAVLIATPAPIAASLVKEINPSLRSNLSRIEYGSSASVYLAYKKDQVKHQLDGTGFLVSGLERSKVTATTFTSSKWGNRSPKGYVLLRIFLSMDSNPTLAKMETHELIDLATKWINPIIGTSGQPYMSKLFRWPISMPKYAMGHLNLIEKINNDLTLNPGLFLTGASYRGIGVPDCVRQGTQSAQEIMDYLTVKLCKE